MIKKKTLDTQHLYMIPTKFYISFSLYTLLGKLTGCNIATFFKCRDERSFVIFNHYSWYWILRIYNNCCIVVILIVQIYIFEYLNALNKFLIKQTHSRQEDRERVNNVFIWLLPDMYLSIYLPLNSCETLRCYCKKSFWKFGSKEIKEKSGLNHYYKHFMTFSILQHKKPGSW